MPLFLASVILGIVPMIAYALIVWRLDRWEKEPLPLVTAAFLWGAVPAVIAAVVAQVILGLPLRSLQVEAPLLGQLYQASLVAPVTEELTKGAGLALLFLCFRREIDSVLDGLVYGSLIGFGFAAVENVLYFAGQTDPTGLAVLFFFRAFVFGMLHALFTGLTGVGFALGKFALHPAAKVLWPLAGLAAATVTHALHNYFAIIGGDHLLFAVGGIGIGLVWFGVTVVVCLVHENRWIRLHLAEEVDRGVLHAQQALDAAGFWTRTHLAMLSRSPAVVLGRKRLLRQATKLAYRKQRRSRIGPNGELDRRIEALREEVQRLSREDPLVLSGAIGAEQRLPPPLP